MDSLSPSTSLRRGWTTGACATAAAKAAYTALLSGEFPDPVAITLPGGQTPAFALAESRLDGDAAYAAVVKDAGDDPDVTHGALVSARVRRLPAGSGIVFRAGPGVGTVTKPGLPLAVGEPAINPVPRQMMRTAIAEIAARYGASADAEVEVSVAGGERLAQKTLNPRLGILGGLSILGTTGIVIPFSCSAWIHSIYRGIDVARAEGLMHIAGATGRTSELAIQRRHHLPDQALIDMGDFVGGMLKYLRKHPVPRVSIAGGFAKMAKLAQGRLDLHSRAGGVDVDFIAGLATEARLPPALMPQIREANTAKHVLDIAGPHAQPLIDLVAARAWDTVADILKGSGILLEIAVFGRERELLASTGFQLIPSPFQGEGEEERYLR